MFFQFIPQKNTIQFPSIQKHLYASMLIKIDKTDEQIKQLNIIQHVFNSVAEGRRCVGLVLRHKANLFLLYLPSSDAKRTAIGSAISRKEQRRLCCRVWIGALQVTSAGVHIGAPHGCACEYMPPMPARHETLNAHTCTQHERAQK